MKELASTRFKNRLRELRQKRGWTQEKAAEVCGLGYKLYQLYELGIKRNPGLLTLEKIAAGYGLDISELLAPFPKGMRMAKAAKTRGRRPEKPQSQKEE